MINSYYGGIYIYMVSWYMVSLLNSYKYNLKLVCSLSHKLYRWSSISEIEFASNTENVSDSHPRRNRVHELMNLHEPFMNRSWTVHELRGKVLEKVHEFLVHEQFMNSSWNIGSWTQKSSWSQYGSWTFIKITQHSKWQHGFHPADKDLSFMIIL